MAKEPKIVDQQSPDSFQRGLDDRDYGRKPPKEPDPDTAAPQEIDDHLARKNAYESRDDYDEHGELKDDL